MTPAAFDLARRSAVGSAHGAESLRWLAHGSYLFKGVEEPVEVFEVGVEGVAPLAPPASSEKVTRVEDEDTILGWRPAPGLAIPYRPDWVVKKKLDAGGFGEIWLGEQQKTGEPRVYKFCYDAERLRSLQREITVFRLLKEELGLREDIVRILGWNLDKAPYFIEFVHIEGGSLVDWAAARGGLAVVNAETPLEDLGVAMSRVHKPTLDDLLHFGIDLYRAAAEGLAAKQARRVVFKLDIEDHPGEVRLKGDTSRITWLEAARDGHPLRSAELDTDKLEKPWKWTWAHSWKVEQDWSTFSVRAYRRSRPVAFRRWKRSELEARRPPAIDASLLFTAGLAPGRIAGRSRRSSQSCRGTNRLSGSRILGRRKRPSGSEDNDPRFA